MFDDICPVDVRLPPLEVVKNRLVVEAVVANRFVEVAFVVVPLVTVSADMVVDACERNPWNVGVPVNAGETLPTTTPVPPVSSVNRAKSSAEVSIEVEDILLLNSDQSDDDRQPEVPDVAVEHVRTPAVLFSPEPVRSVKYSELRPNVEVYIEEVVAFVVVELTAVKF